MFSSVNYKKSCEIFSKINEKVLKYRCHLQSNILQKQNQLKTVR